MKALVLFGSESDKNIYDELNLFLRKDFEVDFAVISAHRNPKELEERLGREDFDFIVAGAGLAAHLPGVCASKTNRPVFGIPVEANLMGLDAFLSIQQMPFGVPVAAFSARKWVSPLSLFKDFKDKKRINIISNNKVKEKEFYTKEIKRVFEYAKTLNLDVLEMGYVPKMININLVNQESDLLDKEGVLNVPLLSMEEKNNPETAIKLMKWFNTGGFWFGINNTRNAICFTQKI